MIPSAGVLLLDCGHGNYILDVKKVHFLLCDIEQTNYACMALMNILQDLS